MNPDGYFLFTHGKRNDETTGEMFGEKFYYSSLDVKKVQCLLKENGFDILICIEDYQEKTSGSRELLVVAKKVRR